MKSFTIAGFALITAFAGIGSVAAADAPAAPTSSTPTAPAADEEAAAGLREHHRHHHHGGVIKFIAMSLDTLGTDEAKRPQIQKLQDDLHAKMAPARDAERELLLTLSDGVAAGKTDSAKVDAAIAKVTTASVAAHDASLESLNKLHALLSPAERAALVDKVQAHWEVWHQVNPEKTGVDKQNGRLQELKDEIGLTPDQVGKVSAALTSSESSNKSKFDAKDAEGRVQAFCKAFAADTFDAKSLPGSVNAPIANHGSERMAHFYEALSPVLTPDQRTKVAEELREHANYGQAPSGK